jgi:hypothetical protein
LREHKALRTLEKANENRVQRMWARVRWAWPALLVFAATRALDAAFLAAGARDQVDLPSSSPAYHVTFSTPSSPSYWQILSNWDGQWYRSIAEFGYPSTLPTENGQVIQNEWAFFPAYPMLVRVVMTLTQLEFGPAASLVSLTSAGAAVLLLYRMLLNGGDRFLALGTVVCLCTFPTAPVLQVAYSESLALLLIVTSTVCLRERRYGWLVIALVCLSLARPLVLPFAAVVAVHWVVRWRQSPANPFPASERVKVAGVVFIAGLSAGLWPAIAAIVTGDTRAFTETQSAWPVNQGGLMGNWLFSAERQPPPGIALFLALGLGVLAFSVSRPAARRWGLELRTWSVAYPLYLLIATRPGPSILRFLLLAIGPLWPLPDVASADESPFHRRVRWCLLIGFALLGIVGQYFWVTRVFTIRVSPGSQLYP